MKSTRRALRRHHRDRMLRRTLRSLVMRDWYTQPDANELRQRALRWYNNLKKCSCYMCGNPRRYEGYRTRQELLQLAAALAEVEE